MLSPEDAGFVDYRAPDRPGLRLAVKDMVGVEGCLQTAGLARFATRRAGADAAAVTRLRLAGFAVVGSGVTDAAGFGTMTPKLRNPRHPLRAVGGSTGGPAAAVAAGLADVGLGTDTGGSVRIPAAYCDLYAFKASHGVLPLDGVIPLSPRFDALGVLAATPDALKVAISGLCDAPLTPSPDIAIAVDSGALNANDRAVAGPFRKLVHCLTPQLLRFPSFEEMAGAHAAVVCRDAAAQYGADAAAHPGAYPLAIEGALSLARRLTTGELAASDASITTMAARIRAHLGQRVLLSPTLPILPAPRHAAATTINGTRVAVTSANIRNTLIANVAGLPSVVVPLPELSLQVIGPYESDLWLADAALAIAARLMR
ncbi:MAG: amidase family protein [Pseudomonadota bacterium]